MPAATDAGAAPRIRRGPRIFGLPFGAVRAGVFLLALFPLARWVWLVAVNDLTANPVEFLTRSSGTWTFVMLSAALAVTPLAFMTGQGAVMRLRRMMGLYAFFYLCLHLTTYVWWDQWFDPAAMLRDIAQRPFIAAGFAAFLMLVPLAITSTSGWIRRLGPKRWQALHRLVYLAALAALLHLVWHKAGKSDFLEPAIFALVLAVLFGWRIARARRRIS